MSRQSGPMRQQAPHLPQPPHPARAAFNAVIFDLDGVVTDTAAVHARATITALAARKQQLFARELAVGGVHAFPGTLALPHRQREQGLPVARVTSSRNSGAVLAVAHLAGLFDVTVDGADARRIRLAGKPDLATEGLRVALCILGERTVENKHLVNTPDWLSLGAGGRRDWFDVSRNQLVTYRQELSPTRTSLWPRAPGC